MTETYPTNPDAYFDAPEEESTLALIASGLGRYANQTKRLLHEHVGNREAYLTPANTYELAQQIQAGISARQALAELPPEDVDSPDEGDIWYRARLGAEAEAGSRARQTLIESNLRFAAYFARASMGILPPDAMDPSTKKPIRMVGAFGDITKLRSPHAVLEDRIQVANVGLVEAVDKFKPTINSKGEFVSFLAYAGWRIHGQLYRYVVAQEGSGGVHFAYSVAEKLYKFYEDDADPELLREQQELRALRDVSYLADVSTELFADEEREDGDDELAQLRLDDVLADIFDEDLSDTASFALLRQQLLEVMQTMSEREAGVVKLRFGMTDGEPRTLDEIGMVYGVTRERVRQIESKTMAKLRHPYRSDGLRDYLGTSYSPSADNNLWGSMMTPPEADVAGFMLHSRSKPSSFTGVKRAVQPVVAERDWESWQGDRDDTWETPVRLRRAEQKDRFDEIYNLLCNNLLNIDFALFLADDEGAPTLGGYPLQAIQEIKQICGKDLTPYHIERFWNEHIYELVNRLETSARAKLDLDKVSLLFSHLIAERMNDDDQITLAIPVSLEGRLNRLGAQLAHGKLTLVGNVGDYTGFGMKGLAHIVVDGDTGDYAASEASGLASLEILGNAGTMLAYKALDGTIRVTGAIASVALLPQFEGEVLAEAVGRVYTGAPGGSITAGGKPLI